MLASSSRRELDCNHLAAVGSFDIVLENTLRRKFCNNADPALRSMPKSAACSSSVTPMIKRRLHLWKRFTFAGALNTVVGSLAIFGLQALTSNPQLSNVLGYIIGGVFGYFVHARYTFRASISKRNFALYASIAVLGFMINLLVLSYALKVASPIFAQSLAILSFVSASYLLQSRLAFPAHSREPLDHAKFNEHS
jgi:putative flippase GtrA